jgi:hypothetical protein
VTALLAVAVLIFAARSCDLDNLNLSDVYTPRDRPDLAERVTKRLDVNTG